MQIATQLKSCAIGGLTKGLRTALWMAKMMIPITLGMSLLKWGGAIDLLSEWLAPAFKFMGLTAEGVLVFITACLSNLYSAIAVIATLNIDYRSATILAVMGLICHNLIVETVIQRKAGSAAWYIVTLRITTAIVAAWTLNTILPVNYNGTLILETLNSNDTTIVAILRDWMWSMAKLLPMMFALIITLNVLQQILREFRLIHYLTIPLLPLMKVFGLSKNSSFLWIVLNTLGLAYGGAVLINEVQSQEISTPDAKLLNTHAAINHSLLEDTILFAAMGLSVFWLIVPRVVLAIVAVWGEKLYNKIHIPWLQPSK